MALLEGKTFPYVPSMAAICGRQVSRLRSPQSGCRLDLGQSRGAPR
jgi:hypothetical protein